MSADLQCRKNRAVWRHESDRYHSFLPVLINFLYFHLPFTLISQCRVSSLCYIDLEKNIYVQLAKFCLVVRGARLGQPTLLEALATGCIPVMCADSLVMPFQDVLDWKR